MKMSQHLHVRLMTWGKRLDLKHFTSAKASTSSCHMCFLYLNKDMIYIFNKMRYVSLLV